MAQISPANHFDPTKISDLEQILTSDPLDNGHDADPYFDLDFGEKLNHGASDQNPTTSGWGNILHLTRAQLFVGAMIDPTWYDPMMRRPP